MALRRPTSWVRVTDTPASGAMPTRTAPDMKRSDSAAITKSEAQTRPNPPPPAANPWTAEITGTWSSSSAEIAICNQEVASRR